MTLNETLQLAQRGIITDITYINAIIRELLLTPVSELAAASKQFTYAIGLEGSYMFDGEEQEEYFCFGDILKIPGHFTDKADAGIRCKILRSIMQGLLEANSLQQVRLFKCLSLNEYLDENPSLDLRAMEDALDENYNLYFDDTEFTFGDFFQTLRNTFYECWDIEENIAFMQDRVMNCGLMLDILFTQGLLNDYKKINRE